MHVSKLSKVSYRSVNKTAPVLYNSTVPDKSIILGPKVCYYTVETFQKKSQQSSMFMFKCLSLVLHSVEKMKTVQIDEVGDKNGQKKKTTRFACGPRDLINIKFCIRRFPTAGHSIRCKTTRYFISLQDVTFLVTLPHQGKTT